MATPRGRGRGRGGGRGRGRGKGRAGAERSKGKDRSSRPRPESDPDNENLYTKVDKFHMEKDKIALDGEESDSNDSDESEQEEAVMGLQEFDDEGGAPDEDEDEDDDDEDDSDDDELSGLPELPEHVRRAGMVASDDSSDDDEDGERKFAAGWGKSRKSYYNGDTADLEIGQEFEDAEAEEEAALELQKSAYKGMSRADFGGDEDEDGNEDGDEDEDEDEDTEVQAGKKDGRKRSKRGDSGSKGAALATMKNDLEQIALGTAAEVETSVVKRDTSQLSRRDKLELVLSEAPELPALMAEVREHLRTLVDRVQPLASNVTVELGASQDGVEYLHTRQQLLLTYCMNVCFYMVLKARGEPAKAHPVVHRLLSLRGLLGDMSELDKKLEPQMDLLLRAMSAPEDESDGEGSADGDDVGDGQEDPGGEEDEDEEVEDEEDDDGEGDGAEGIDEEDLEQEELRFMGTAAGGGGVGTSEDELEEGKAGSAAAKKKRRRAAKEAKKSGTWTSDGPMDDFGDDVNELNRSGGRAGRENGHGETLLQGMMNRISQRERSAGKKSGMDGDQDVPVRERDQTIRVRRPAPGESEEDEEGGGEEEDDDAAAAGSQDGVEDEGDEDSDGDDLDLGSGGFLGGLPPEVLQGLASGGGDGKKAKRKKSGGKRSHAEADREAEAGEEADAFYSSVVADKQRKKQAKEDKYQPKPRIAGALEAELETEIAAQGGGKRAANYAMMKNKGLTPHKNKRNRNPRVKKREAFRRATIRRKGQVREVRTNEADSYGGEATGIRARVTRGRKLHG